MLSEHVYGSLHWDHILFLVAAGVLAVGFVFLGRQYREDMGHTGALPFYASAVTILALIALVIYYAVRIELSGTS